MTGISPNRADAFASLGDPVRRELYRAVATSSEPLTRDAAADAVGVPRSTAAFHLDRLLEAGLLHAEYRRLSGRSGPGAGRPAKLYRAASAEIAGSLPERHYELAGELLAAAIERADAEGVRVRDALTAQARATGAALGAAQPPEDGLEGALAACGYAPREDGAGGVVLDNCPFHALASRHTPLVCAANLSLVEGIVEGAGDRRVAVLAPREGRCCVAIHALPTRETSQMAAGWADSPPFREVPRKCARADTPRAHDPVAIMGT